MSYFGKIFCLLLSILVLLGAAFAVHRLPVPDTDVLRQSQESWSGVLRIWISEGWECGSGSLIAWLNAASTQFEKRHKGVYLHFIPVSAETLASFNYAAEYPPDLLIFAPGMLSSPDDLLRLPENTALRPEFRGYGDSFVRPIAMGGYAWVTNPALRADETLFLMPEDQPFLSYSAALPSLLTREKTISGENSVPDSRYGVDLGLPTPTNATSEALLTERYSLRPAAGSGRAENAYALFTRGEAGTIAVTQREIRRLQLLDDSGRAPDWTVIVGDAAFTDQIALAAVVDIYRSDLSARQELCLGFIDFLLTDERQKTLTTARAFRVTDGAPLYAGQKGMAQLEETLIRCPLDIPDAFDPDWRSAAHTRAETLFQGE